MQEEEQISKSKPPTTRTGYSFRGRAQDWFRPSGSLRNAFGAHPKWSTRLYSLERKLRILAPRTGCDPNWCMHMRALEGSALKLCYCSEPNTPRHTIGIRTTGTQALFLPKPWHRRKTKPAIRVQCRDRFTAAHIKSLDT